MRLTSSLFVSALMRRLFAEGLMCVVEAKGAQEAGAIFIRVVKRNRTQTLLSPAPQAFLEEASERVFEVRLKDANEQDVNERLAREQSFDDDIWIIEIETDSPENYLNIIEDE